VNAANTAETMTAGVSVGDQATAPAALLASDTVNWATLLVVLTGIFMSTLDIFIVNVAIPSTQQDLHASDSAVQWIIAGFGLAVAAGVITAGRLGDMFGRRRMFSLGLGLFTIASAACGFAPTASTLIGARVIQGLAAALLTPQVLAILGTAFRGRALTTAITGYGLAMGLAAIFGQLIGGALIQANIAGAGWRSCFLINVPVGIAAVALVPRVVPESKAPRRHRLDWIGTALLTGALVAIVLPLIQGRQQGWPLWTFLSFAVGAALLADFAWYERRITRSGREPLINLSLFADRAFSTGVLVQLVAFMGQLSFFLVLAVYVQNGVGLTPLRSGVLFIAIGSGYVITAMASGAVSQRLGRQTVALGALTMIGGLLLLDLGIHRISAGSAAGSVLWLVPGLVVDGAGMGLIIAPMTSLVLARVAPKHVGLASGVLSTVTQLGGALGVALIGIVFYGSISHPHAGAVRAVRTVGRGFTSSSYLLIAIAATVLAGIQLLPRRPATDR
jgi:EmrB/QacA subfamily drug resistance transporter